MFGSQDGSIQVMTTGNILQDTSGTHPIVGNLVVAPFETKKNTLNQRNKIGRFNDAVVPHAVPKYAWRI
jgi:hypothetical protein